MNKAPYPVIRLLKNHLYPTFQLHAFMANDKTDLKAGLRLAALTTMQWVKARLQENAPESWDSLPGPEDYLSATDDDLPSLYLNQGHVVNIVSLPSEGMWALQITEPDLGSKPGTPNQDRAPVPGRVIETNVSYKISGKRLECGFQTVFSDPEGTASEADVYRLAVVGQLIYNPAFGLKLGGDILRELIRISNKADIDTMLWAVQHAENQLPAVIFSQILEDVPVQNANPMLFGQQNRSNKPIFAEKPNFEEKLGLSGKKSPIIKKEPVKDTRASEKIVLSGKPLFSGSLPQLNLPVKKENVPPVKMMKRGVDPSCDFEKHIKYVFAECRSYLLEYNALESFIAKTGIQISPGDAVVIYPSSLCGGYRVFKYETLVEDGKLNPTPLETEVRRFMKESPIAFGEISFLSGTRELLLQASDKLIANHSKQTEAYQLKLAETIALWKEDRQKEAKNNDRLEKELAKQKERTSQAESEKVALRDQIDEVKKRLSARIDNCEKSIEYLKSKQVRPKEYRGIQQWVADEFRGRLVLHERAVRELDKSTSTISTDLICDALCYLASEQWERHFCQLSEEDAQMRSSDKYSRPFIVSQSGDGIVKYAYADYHVSYQYDSTGTVDQPLDWHLKVGIHDNVLRIYFFYDEEQQLIVVGSLPEHLKTTGYR